jgi:hypothetical protein
MKTKVKFKINLKYFAALLAAALLIVPLTACNDEDDDHPFGVRVNMELRVRVEGAMDSNILVPDEEVDLDAYRSTYNSALFKWEKDDRISTSRYTLGSQYTNAGYTEYWLFHHDLYWRAPNHHDEIVMRAKLASQDDNMWVETKFTYEDARDRDDDETTVQRTLVIQHPDY